MIKPIDWTVHAWDRLATRYVGIDFEQYHIDSVIPLIEVNFRYKFENDHFSARPDKIVYVKFKIKSWPNKLNTIYEYKKRIILTVLPLTKDEKAVRLYLLSDLIMGLKMFPVANNKSKVKINVAHYIKTKEEYTTDFYQGFNSYREFLNSKSKTNLRKTYCTGLCGILATVMHQLTGFKVVGVKSLIYRCDYKEEIEDFYCHVGVITKENVIIDSNGYLTKDEFIRPYIKMYKKVCCEFMPEVDYYKPDFDEQYYYAMCLLEHVPILLPEYASLIKSIELYHTK